MRSVSDIVASLLCASLAGGMVIGAIRLKIGTPTEPQPGFFPFLGGILLLVLSFILFFQAWLGRTRKPDFGDLRRPAKLIAALVLYIALLESLGYIISTSLLSATVLVLMKTRSRPVIAGVSLLLAVGTYLLFDRMLSMPLPAGILGSIL